jgi:penicillin-binding protein 1A
MRFDLNDVGKIPERSILFDRYDKMYSRFGTENRTTTKLSKISEHFVPALLAREDTRFYEHRGVDYQGILRASFRNISALAIREGGSTLTQQLARNSFSLGRQSIHRKLLEAMIARRIENKYTKEQIIEFYVNRIYFGSGVYG